MSPDEARVMCLNEVRVTVFVPRYNESYLCPDVMGVICI
jgi:hypothetical protein